MTTSGDNFTMPVAPMGYGNGGFGGGFGNDGGWWLLILLFALGGWGNGGFGGFGGGDMVMPYMWNTATQNDVNRGFDNAGIAAQLSGIQTSISNGFASAEVAECNRAANAMQTAYTNQIASMNQSFANQQALDARLYAMQSAQADCCCENRLATCQTQNIIQNEANATRFADTNNTRDIITSQTASTQAIMDKLCQLELDAKNDKISDLERQLTMATLAASQGAQTAAILANNEAQTTALEQYLAPVPKPAYIVQNPNCCGNNYGYGGCGCGVA